MIKEIGGYIELDNYTLPMFHEGALMLNCGRNALAYLIKARKINKIYLPYFLCSSVTNVCSKYHVDITYYHITKNFIPQITTVDNNAWVYIVNYYGQLSTDMLAELAEKYQHIIIDNAQDYFAQPLPHIDTLYTCRKFFGVSDGAFLYTDAVLNEELPLDESFERIHFLLGRYERTASEFYREASANNKFFETEPIKRMSRLTENLLHGLNYEVIKQKRTENYAYLYEEFEDINELNIKQVEGAFMYPLMISNAKAIKENLQKKHIYIPTLWPNILNDMPENRVEWHLANDVLPLPCDQRYDLSDMQFISEQVKILL